ncbi:MAG: FkbM family methyltransferase [Tannerellaceae bacterium]|jgi:FkbM family methyltransferase|nr:FkbM family methyltransferase [Tannerellaceae bacterium]
MDIKNYQNKFWQNLLLGRRYKRWTYLESFAYLMKGVARELNIAPDFFVEWYNDIAIREFKRKWLKKDRQKSYFNFNDCKLPDVSNSKEKTHGLMGVFEDVFLFPCYHNDNYNKSFVLFMDAIMTEGPYGYVDDCIDVRIKKGDIVIDAGAWIGDFSAYANSKEAIVYAFEPAEETFHLLCETKDLNNTNSLFCIKKGLGDGEYENELLTNRFGYSNTCITDKDLYGSYMQMSHDCESSQKEKILITTLDKFVEENNIARIDFIKADIEGYERNMLKGASNVLKTFAPKLAICTYHLVDDPEVLEKIILEANPKYTVVHLKHKLFAAVV